MTSAERETLRERLGVTTGTYLTLEIPPRPARDLLDPEALARAADEVPRVAPERHASGRSVAALYAEILRTSVSPSASTAAVSRAVLEARRLLFDDAAAQTPSRAHRAYLQRKAALDAARHAGRPGSAEWAALQVTQPGRIEGALATLSQHGRGDLATAFAEALAAFELARRDGASGSWFPCEATPARFWEADASVASSETSQPASARVTRVLLDRPWLRLALLSRGGWSTPGRDAGAYSNGRADESNTGLLPLIPSALVLEWPTGEEPRIVAWENLVVPPCPPR